MTDPRRTPSPPTHHCDQEHRLCAMERAIERLRETQQEHATMLTSGRIEFAEIRKDIASLTEAVKGLTATFQWVGGFVVLAVMGAILKLVIVGA